MGLLRWHVRGGGDARQVLGRPRAGRDRDPEPHPVWVCGGSVTARGIPVTQQAVPAQAVPSAP
jgi:hypothetical protein